MIESPIIPPLVDQKELVKASKIYIRLGIPNPNVSILFQCMVKIFSLFIMPAFCLGTSSE